MTRKKAKRLSLILWEHLRDYYSTWESRTGGSVKVRAINELKAEYPEIEELLCEPHNCALCGIFDDDYGCGDCPLESCFQYSDYGHFMSPDYDDIERREAANRIVGRLYDWEV